VVFANYTDVRDVQINSLPAAEVGAGEVLFHQGDTGDVVYVVESGAIEIVRELLGAREELVHVAQVSTYFGELSPMLGTPRSATARAQVDTVLLAYSPIDFRALGLGRPPAAVG